MGQIFTRRLEFDKVSSAYFTAERGAAREMFVQLILENWQEYLRAGVWLAAKALCGRKNERL